MIQLTIIGHIGADAETKKINGNDYHAFNVAANHTDGTTTWVSVLYRYNENLAQYLTKGTQVYIQGNPRFDAYNKRDGSVGVDVKILASTLQLLGGVGSNTPEAKTGAQAQKNDEIPF